MTEQTVRRTSNEETDLRTYDPTMTLDLLDYSSWTSLDYDLLALRSPPEEAASKLKSSQM
jgi:hypothetical protein